MSKSKTGVAKERAWRETIAEQQKSRQSVRAFCRNRQINESSFYRWRKLIQPSDQNADGKKAVFAPVAVVDEPAAAIEIVLTDETTVRVPPHATPEQLGMVLAALDSTRC